jgi:hypothetical protein
MTSPPLNRQSTGRKSSAGPRTGRRHTLGHRRLQLCRYVEAVVLAEQAAGELAATGVVVDGKLSPWFQAHQAACKTVAVLALRLRLGPQSRQPRAHKTTTAAVSYYERMQLEGRAMKLSRVDREALERALKMVRAESAAEREHIDRVMAKEGWQRAGESDIPLSEPRPAFEAVADAAVLVSHRCRCAGRSRAAARRRWGARRR